jgi:hypothetical protein
MRRSPSFTAKDATTRRARGRRRIAAGGGHPVNQITCTDIGTMQVILVKLIDGVGYGVGGGGGQDAWSSRRRLASGTTAMSAARCWSGCCE